jgi:hypothetical protein
MGLIQLGTGMPAQFDGVCVNLEQTRGLYGFHEKAQDAGWVVW